MNRKPSKKELKILSNKYADCIETLYAYDLPIKNIESMNDADLTDFIRLDYKDMSVKEFRENINKVKDIKPLKDIVINIIRKRYMELDYKRAHLRRITVELKNLFKIHKK